MITWLIDYLMKSGGASVYSLIFLFVVLDATLFLGFLLPGEAPVIVGGVLAGRDAISLWGVGAVVAIAAFVGDSFSYWLGWWVGVERTVRWGHRIGVTRERFMRAEEFFQRQGGIAVFAGRFASVFRPVVPFVADASRITYRRFALFNLPAGVVWASLFIGLGYWAGEQWQTVARWVDRVGWLVVIAVIVSIAVKWAKGRST